MSSPHVGAAAPEFSLPGSSAEGRGDYRLGTECGHPVVLVFYPGDDTPVCTRQLCSYQRDLALLTELGATVWGISTQDLDSHERFAAKQGLTFPLLADIDGEVHRAYGLGGVLNRRAIFVVDADGRVAWQHVSMTGLTYQTAERIAEVLRSLPSRSYPAGAATADDSPDEGR